MDLELAINYTNKYNSYDIIQSVFDLIRDMRQYHWLNEKVQCPHCKSELNVNKEYEIVLTTSKIR